MQLLKLEFVSSFKSHILVFLCVLTACTMDNGPLEVDGGLDGGDEAAEANREQPTRAEPDEPAERPAAKPEDKPKAPIDATTPVSQVTPDAGMPAPSMTPDASAPDAAPPTPPEADAGTPAPAAPSGSTPNDNPWTS
jgi:hypothetical protein